MSLFGSAVCSAIVLAASMTALDAAAAGQSLDSGAVVVKVDAAGGTFSLADKATGVEFVKRGLPATPSTSIRCVRVKDAPLGEADAIEIAADGGNVIVLAAYPSTPFVFIRLHHVNSGSQPEAVSDLRPVTIPLQLDAPTAELTTLGTAGLTACDANPGSYTFLAVANPKTRAGVVVAWLTQDRGSGLVFSHVEGDAVEIEPRCEYGGLPLDAGAALDSEWLAVGYFADARLGLERYADHVASYYSIKLPPQPSGYCTWYSDRAGGA